MKKLNFIYLFLILTFAIQFAYSQATPIIGKTGSPAIYDTSGSVAIDYALTEEDYKFVAQQLSSNPNYVLIKNKPAKLSSEAHYGWNLGIGGKTVGWILDGNETLGYFFYADWNGDGNLANDKPIRFEKKDDKYQLTFSKTYSETIDKKKQKYPYQIRIVVAQNELIGSTEKRLSLELYDETVRRGTLEIDSRQMDFWLLGARGIYNYESNKLYFDLDGNGKFDPKRRFSAELYNISEKYINIGDKTYEFSVDRYGKELKLTSLSEKLSPRSELEKGFPAPDFSFKDINDQPHRLSEFRGKVVLLDFWGTWCGPCIAEVPQLVTLHKVLKEKGFEIISLAKGDTVQKVREFMAKKEMDWTHTIPTEDVVKLYRISGYPTYFLIDKDGKITENNISAGEKINQKVEELLAKK